MSTPLNSYGLAAIAITLYTDGSVVSLSWGSSLLSFSHHWGQYREPLSLANKTGMAKSSQYPSRGVNKSLVFPLNDPRCHNSLEYTIFRSNLVIILTRMIEYNHWNEPF